MASEIFVFCLTCVVMGKTAQVTQSSSHRGESRFISAKMGDSVSLQCSYSLVGWLYWYKQAVGHKPRLVSTFLTYDSTGSFADEFLNDWRFALDTTNGKCDVKISDLQVSDSATYFCIASQQNKITFLQSVTVSVKASGLDVQTSVRQSESESVHPGDSVTLNCTVHTQTCDGEHSVYWFKQSQDPRPGIIYTHRGREEQCERKNHTPTHTCVYNLPIRSMGRNHTGTYYCAVASCGQVLFGKGTTLDFKCDSVSIYYLSGAMAFTILLNLLGFFLYKMKKRRVSHSGGFQARPSAPPSTNTEDTESPHYAALSVNIPNVFPTHRRQRDDAKNECVYSTVKT